TEFHGALIDAGLLKHKELPMLRPLLRAVVLYAISVIHQCIIDLGDGTKAEMHATWDTGLGHMGVWANASLDPSAQKIQIAPSISDLGTSVAGPLVETNIVAAECCEPELLGRSKIGWWDFPIGLKPNQRLGRLGS